VALRFDHSDSNREEKMATASALLERKENPLDTIEQIAALQQWSFERLADDEVNITASGQWADYHLSFNWRDDLEGLHLACAFDFKVPPTRTWHPHG
jgi:hypothetical protein